MTADGILSGPIDLDAPRRQPPVEIPAPVGTDVAYLPDRIGGVVDGWKGDRILIRDRRGRVHVLATNAAAFEIDGRRGRPVPARPAAAAPGARETRSGSVAADHAPRVARGSRLWVEGVHDAELVEKVWGDDLRYEGIVVERLDGADDLAAEVAAFGPRADARLGVLLDHLVPGTKEQRIADAVRQPNVLVLGHPFVDVWQAVRPEAAGLPAWPSVPPGERWKDGVIARLGLEVEPGAFWRQLLGRIDAYTDLEPPLVHAVERLIDFVTDGP